LNADIEKYQSINNKELNTSKSVIIITSALILILLIWQTFSASKIHQQYQASLMDSVTTQVLSDYQEYFSQLRLEMDLFQQKQLNAIEKIQQAGQKANQSDYMSILKSLRSDIKNSRLFALIDKNGIGSLKHITGNFLPACEDEIISTITSGEQKHLFLHRSKNSVHFDLLQPLSTIHGKKSYFFVAFNPDVLIELLKKYQLPYQQLFLMRTDNIGEIELTTESDNSKYASMSMNKEELNDFTYVKAIPNTRWKLAIRLDPQYSSNLYKQGLLKAIGIWAVLTLLIYSFYRQQKMRQQKHLQMKQEIIYKDNHDQLTGLVNRVSFDRQLNEYIKSNRKKPSLTTGVVLHIDIDNFQVINNSFGYTIGDEFLNTVSYELKVFLPRNTVISRLGNDEFAILLPSLNHHECKGFAHKLRLYFQKIHIDALPKDNNITASIGVVILNNSIFNAEQVFSSLGQAVSLAKEKGRNRVQIYQSDDKQLIQHADDMKAVHDVSEALKNNNLILYRQEIKPLQKSDCMHYEILVRIVSAQGAIIPPNSFIPAAEKYGLIRHIDHWVIEQTFKKITENSQDISTEYSINLSGVTLADRDIYDVVIALFEKYNVAPHRICFEITETSAITHLKSALHFITQMSDYGCYFSLDDFGSGLSSFSYLQQLPVAIIKIDGMFVKDMDTNEVNRIFVENIKRTATAMNKKTIAEFVENAEIEQLLKEIGIDYGQGYHIHKPEPWV